MWALALRLMMLVTVLPIPEVALVSTVRFRDPVRAAEAMAFLGESMRLIMQGPTIMLLPVTVVVAMVPRTMASRGFVGSVRRLMGRL